MTVPRCLRCQGWLAHEAHEETEEGCCSYLRCVNCGWRVDPVMAAHRQLPVPPAPYSDAIVPVWDPVGAVLRMKQRRAGDVGPRGTQKNRPS